MSALEEDQYETNYTEKIAGKWQDFFVPWVLLGARTYVLKGKGRETEQEIRD